MRLISLVCLALALATGCGGRTPLAVGHDDGAPVPATCDQPNDTWVIFEVISPADAVLYAARSDGSDLHRLPVPDLRAIYPAVSPDGRTLAYSATDITSESAIVLFDFASSARTVVVPHGGRPTFAPIAQRLAYGDGINIHLVGLDGEGDTTLVPGPSPQQTGYGNPSFIDDAHVVFDRGGGVESIATDGSARRTLLTTDGSRVTFPSPSLSWDKQTLAAVVDCGGTVALRTWPLASPGSCASGNIVTKVDLGQVNASSTAWSPNGKIAFVQGKELLVIPANADAAVYITTPLGLQTKNAGAGHPVFTPPCTKIP
ncbi:hypothetical protein BH09MYX1_BH09MYX1_02060 [soil metagenome]